MTQTQWIERTTFDGVVVERHATPGKGHFRVMGMGRILKVSGIVVREPDGFVLEFGEAGEVIVHPFGGGDITIKFEHQGGVARLKFWQDSVEFKKD